MFVWDQKLHKSNIYNSDSYFSQFLQYEEIEIRRKVCSKISNMMERDRERMHYKEMLLRKEKNENNNIHYIIISLCNKTKAASSFDFIRHPLSLPRTRTDVHPFLIE